MGVAELATFSAIYELRAGAALISRVNYATRSSSNLLNLATAPSKGGLTAVGRAIQKQGSRQGSLFPKATGNAASMNAQGKIVLQNIINHPSASTVTRHHGRFGNIMEIKIPMVKVQDLVQMVKPFLDL